MQGDFSFAFTNKSLTLLAPTPTNNSTNSEAEIERKGTPDSPAMAFASSVLPVPGGPINKTPLGLLLKIGKFLGSFRNLITSFNSSSASGIPTTSQILFLHHQLL